jgi:ankyrin repeat protein
MNNLDNLIAEIEYHSPEGIRKYFENGVSPNQLFRNEPLIYELTSEYARTPAFKDCVQVFVDYGLEFEDKVLLSVLLDDAKSLETYLLNSPGTISKKYTLRSAYTPLYEASLLHICAEFNHISCAKVLVKHGTDINTPAGIDENGFGGQTPIFHTVNQNKNNSIEMLHYLLSLSADLLYTVPGIVWGKGYEWETLIPAVNPISYAMMGSLPQMHRNELTVAETVSLLLEAAYGIKYVPANIPNAYLKK